MSFRVVLCRLEDTCVLSCQIDTHCAVRLVSIVLELAIGISYIKNVANFMQNVNPLTEI